MPFLPPTDKQARLFWTALSGLAIAALVGLVVALIWGLGRLLHLLAPILWPLAVAGVLAYLLDPVVDFFERKGVPRTRAIIVVFVLALVLVAGLLGSVVPQLVVETKELSSRIPRYVEVVQKKTESWISNPPAWVRQFLGPKKAIEVPATNGTNTVPTILETTVVTTNDISPIAQPASVSEAAANRANIQSATSWIAKALPAVGSWIAHLFSFVGSWLGIMAGLALIPIYAFYFLLEKEGIAGKWPQYLPVKDSSFKNELVFVLRSINEYLIAFFRGQVLVAICDGVLYTIGFLIIGIPYAILIGAIAIVLTLIPFLGAMITCALALILAVVQYGDWQHPALVLAVFAVVQTLEGLVIAPKIIGDRVGLHPLTIIIAVIVGTTLLGGILGGVLAIPFTAALRTVMFRYVWKKPSQV
jgi:predicted PurR-regulated permease PerM